MKLCRSGLLLFVTLVVAQAGAEAAAAERIYSSKD
jgi:hypothetical protein